jgi:TfoX/Sxy family transcriptional regulator of competence genes
MAYDEGTAQRLRDALAGAADVQERKMFGGLCLMVRGHMLCGVTGVDLMVRVGPDGYADALARPHAREMDFTGKALKGFVYVEEAGFAEDKDLEAWMALAMAYNESQPAK